MYKLIKDIPQAKKGSIFAFTRVKATTDKQMGMDGYRLVLSAENEPLNLDNSFYLDCWMVEWNKRYFKKI